MLRRHATTYGAFHQGVQLVEVELHQWGRQRLEWSWLGLQRAALREIGVMGERRLRNWPVGARHGPHLGRKRRSRLVVLCCDASPRLVRPKILVRDVAHQIPLPPAAYRASNGPIHAWPQRSPAQVVSMLKRCHSAMRIAAPLYECRACTRPYGWMPIRARATAVDSRAGPHPTPSRLSSPTPTDRVSLQPATPALTPRAPLPDAPCPRPLLADTPASALRPRCHVAPSSLPEPPSRYLTYCLGRPPS